MSDDMRPPAGLIARVLRERWCKCCPSCNSTPCDGSMVTGVCDFQRCSCDDEPTDLCDEDEDDGPDTGKETPK